VALLNDQVVAQTRAILAAMRDPVRVTFFTSAQGCAPCPTVASFLGELAAIEPRVLLETRDFDAEPDVARALGVHAVPAMALRREGDARYPVRFYGLPSGHEFGAFLRILILLSTGRGTEGVDAAAVAGIGRDANLKVFVLGSCPRCPEAALLGASVAAASPRVTAEIIEADAFPDLVRRFGLAATPTIVIDDAEVVVERLSPPALVARIAASPAGGAAPAAPG
jgi:alkyl hydroperoxide reductase subunit AhpF